MTSHVANSPRTERQSGQSIIEFAFVVLLFLPLLLGTVVTGISLVRNIQVNQVARNLASMYIHGADFSTYPMQQLTQRLARGLDLQIGTAFAGGVGDNSGNSGAGLVTVSQIMYIGSTTGATCTAVGGVNCVNHDSFVFTQRVRFGNRSLASRSPGTFGSPSTTAMTSSGSVIDPIEDSGARLNSSGQTLMQNLWPGNRSLGQAPMQDGQVTYVVEVYFQQTGTMGSFSGGGLYARCLF